jgi:hypothetical protein
MVISATSRAAAKILAKSKTVRHVRRKVRKVVRRVHKTQPPGTVKVGKRFRKQNLWEGKGIKPISDKEYDKSFYHHDASGNIITGPDGEQIGFKSNIKDHNDPGRWFRGEPDSHGRTYTTAEVIKAASKGKYPDGTQKLAWEINRDEWMSIIPKNKQHGRTDLIRLYHDSEKAQRKYQYTTARKIASTTRVPPRDTDAVKPFIFAYRLSEDAKLSAKTFSADRGLTKSQKRWVGKSQKKLKKMQPLLEKYETYWDDPGPVIQRHKKVVAGGAVAVTTGGLPFLLGKQAKAKKPVSKKKKKRGGK